MRVKIGQRHAVTAAMAPMTISAANSIQDTAPARLSAGTRPAAQPVVQLQRSRCHRLSLPRHDEWLYLVRKQSGADYIQHMHWTLYRQRGARDRLTPEKYRTTTEIAMRSWLLPAGLLSTMGLGVGLGGGHDMPVSHAQEGHGDAPTAIVLKPARVFDGIDADRARGLGRRRARRARSRRRGPRTRSTCRPAPASSTLPDTTLLPGLIDAHTHVLLAPVQRGDLGRPGARRSRSPCASAGRPTTLRDTLLAGFTTIRDLGTEGAGYADVGLKQAIDQGIVPGPRHARRDAGHRRHRQLRPAGLRPGGPRAAGRRGGRRRRRADPRRARPDRPRRRLDQVLRRLPAGARARAAGRRSRSTR